MIQKNISSLQTIGKLSIPIKEFEVRDSVNMKQSKIFERNCNPME